MVKLDKILDTPQFSTCTKIRRIVIVVLSFHQKLRMAPKEQFETCQFLADAEKMLFIGSQSESSDHEMKCLSRKQNIQKWYFLNPVFDEEGCL